jgi:hypothetical protein
MQHLPPRGRAAPPDPHLQGGVMSYTMELFECCRHCPDDCGAEDRHRFRCNACQPRVEDQP